VLSRVRLYSVNTRQPLRVYFARHGVVGVVGRVGAAAHSSKDGVKVMTGFIFVKGKR
jgi:hypothetical protein